jgi:hypothetical protein
MNGTALSPEGAGFAALRALLLAAPVPGKRRDAATTTWGWTTRERRRRWRRDRRGGCRAPTWGTGHAPDADEVHTDGADRMRALRLRRDGADSS